MNIVENESRDIICNAINSNNIQYQRPVLYRSLNILEEKEAFESLINEPDNTIILYDDRNNHRYYFGKFNNQVYHVVTKSDMTFIYCVRQIEVL
jgi:hypothetical protein